MIPLPMGELCSGKEANKGCGQCCKQIGFVPFTVRNPDLPQQEERRLDSYEHNNCSTLHTLADELDILVSMPAELRAELATQLTTMDKDPTGQPCPWLGEDNRCSHYEWRPVSCRVWPVGGKGCTASLNGAIVDMWGRNDNDPDHWRNPRRTKRPHSIIYDDAYGGVPKDNPITTPDLDDELQAIVDRHDI